MGTDTKNDPRAAGRPRGGHDSSEIPPDTARPDLSVVRVDVERRFAEVVETGLRLLGLNPAIWDEADTPFVRFEEFFDTASEAESRRSELEGVLAGWARGERWTIAVHRVPAEDWRHAWKRFFHVMRVSARIVVRPSWEQYRGADGECVIQIDPGMSFGTGQHATTSACLRFIDCLSGQRPGASFLDIGCGSGILSIAAAKLGFSGVTAIDRDPVAVDTARRNAAANGVAAQVDCRVADIARFECPAPYEVVAANLCAGTLESEAGKIARSVAAGSGCALIFAGTLAGQYAAVVRAYAPFGFTERDARESEGWASGWLERAGAVSPGRDHAESPLCLPG
ncbi:50S ribosomal protein L11 methyltransferase [Verrucomicrobiota bacterium]